MSKKSVPINIPHRRPSHWTVDSKVQACFECRQQFSFLIRKHHCRVCGRIFCYDCSKYKTVIPSFVRHFIATSLGSTSLDDEKRVCHTCYIDTVEASNSKDEVYLIANLPLSTREIFKLSMVSRRWMSAVKTVQMIWNSIQYKLPHTKFTKLEKYLLHSRFHEISGHSAWVIPTIKAIQKIPPQTKTLVPCKTLFCKPNCDRRLQIFELLELYTHNHVHTKKVDKWAAEAWKAIPLEYHRNMMPWWVHIFRVRPHIATNIFIQLIKDDIPCLFSFLFEMKLQALSSPHSAVLWATINKCLEMVKPELKNQWEESDKFIDLLERISKHDFETRREREITDWIIQHKTICCPWNPDIQIQSIGTKPFRLKSASKPLKITLYTSTGTMDILFKQEDVRKDRMTLIIAYWIEVSTQQAVQFSHYTVMPITHKSGIVEMLPGVTTLYDVKHRYNTTLQNFILERNSDLTVASLRTRFVKSVAAACVLSYVLGVGDRHLENMLVTDTGELIHVDFYYLLGDDPKHVSTEMRITPDILEALGGIGSATFTEFQELCSDVYQQLRCQSSFWYCMLVYLAEACPRIGHFGGDRQRIQQHVLERLCPGELDTQASMQIVDILKRSSNDSWKMWGADKAHSFAKQASSLVFNLEL